MTRFRIILLVVLLGAGSYCTYWAMSAQEQQIVFDAPQVLPDEKAAPKKVIARVQPKGKADPTLIVPPEVYDIPRPVAHVDTKSAVVQAGGLVPPKLPIEPEVKAKDPAAPPSLPPLPPLDLKPLEVPAPEPTKALIGEGAKEPTPAAPPTLVLPPPVVLPETKSPTEPVPPPAPTPIAPPALPTPALPESMAPLPTLKIAPEPKQEATALPPPVMPPPVMPAPVMPPPLSPAPVAPALTPEPKAPVLPPPSAIPPIKPDVPAQEVTTPKKESAPPTLVMPEPKQEPAAPLPEPTKPKAFVRIKADSRPAPVPSMVPPPAPENPPIQAGHQTPIGPPPVPVPVPAPVGAGALVSLQTPTVIAEKRGPTILQAGETSEYRMIVRNLGPNMATLIRVEDELPAGVKLVAADPLPALQGNRVVWSLQKMPAQTEQVLRFTLQAEKAVEMHSQTSVLVTNASQAIATTSALRPRPEMAGPLTVQLVGPSQVAVGGPAQFEINVTNASAQPLTGLVLHGSLPEGLDSPAGREIEGSYDGAIAPGESKTLKMPASTVKAGRYTVAVKVTANGGVEASASAAIEISGTGSLILQQAPTTRLLLGRDGELRIELSNQTGRELRHIQVADRLPDGLDFLGASNQGMYQANSRVVHWLFDSMPAGQSVTLVIRVAAAKAGQQPNVVAAKADGVPEVQSTGALALEGFADLTLKVLNRDTAINVGNETTFEIVVANIGTVPAYGVQMQGQFPPGLLPKAAQGTIRYSLTRQGVVFEPLMVLQPKEQAIFRVSAQGLTRGDHRVRFAVVSEQVREPIVREVSMQVDGR